MKHCIDPVNPVVSEQGLKLSEAPPSTAHPFHRCYSDSCFLCGCSSIAPLHPLYRPPAEADSVFLLSLHNVSALISVPDRCRICRIIGSGMCRIKKLISVGPSHLAPLQRFNFHMCDILSLLSVLLSHPAVLVRTFI